MSAMGGQGPEPFRGLTWQIEVDGDALVLSRIGSPPTGAGVGAEVRRIPLATVTGVDLNYIPVDCDCGLCADDTDPCSTKGSATASTSSAARQSPSGGPSTTARPTSSWGPKS